MDSTTTQPVNLKICLYGGNQAMIQRSFDPSTTLVEVQREMLKVFNISPDRETKFWLDSSCYTFKPSSNNASTSNNQSLDTKENNSLTTDTSSNNISNSKTNDLGNSISSSTSSSSSTTSPIKPPPTPPPMPSSSSSSTTTNNTSPVTPTVVTRQAANSMNKQQPIALPDSTSISSTSPLSKSASILSTSVSPNSNNQNSNNHHEASPTQTLAEAGLANNTIVTLEVINGDGTWPSCRPRFGTVTTRSTKAQPGLCGLSNMGNTCFMNAALQCLSNTAPLTNYILSDKFVDDINTSNPLGMHGEIARTYAELIKVMWGGNNTSFLPREFKCAVSRFAPQFTGFSQQDCQELMAFLLDGLHEDLNRIRNKPYIESKQDDENRPDIEVAKESWENYKKRNDSIVVDTFHAMLKSTLVCPECNKVSVTFDPFCYLSLPLPVKREKQVNLTFLPAPSKLDKSKIKTALSILDPDNVKIILQFGGKISSFDCTLEEHAGYADPTNRPKGCKMQVPRSGPARELCEIVARIINEENSSDGEKVKSDNLVVAELAMGRISKIYESSEHYNQISDDIVVVEKASKYVLPLYLKERKDMSDSIYGMSKLLFLHVPDLKYETLYKSIIASLSNVTADDEVELRSWIKLSPPTELDEQMDCDGDNDGDDEGNDHQDNHNDSRSGNDTDSNMDEDGNEILECSNEMTNTKTNGKNGPKTKSKTETMIAFDLATVNSFGNHSLETLGPNRKECDYSSKLYLGATFTNEVASTPQFEHNRAPKSESIDTFTPRLSAKPTLQLKDCITQFTNAERLGADDPWYCPKCKKHQQAIKKFDIWSLPKVLIIHLKRFSFSRSWRDKIDTLVEFPVENLDMSNYVHNPEQKKNARYNLIGVANHFGGLGGGHYTAFAKNAILDAWYSFDDAIVTSTTSNDVVTRSAYVLFYQLQETGGQTQ